MKDSNNIEVPEGVGIQINDVNKSMWAYIRKRKLLEIILIATLTIAWEVGATYIAILYFKNSHGSSSGGARGMAFMFVGPLIFISFWINKIKAQFENAFLEEFANANSYKFAKAGTVDETYGSIFKIQGKQSVSDITTGEYEGKKIRLFLFDLLVGSGRYSQEYKNTVLEIDLEGTLPNLFMLNKKSKLMNVSKGNLPTQNTVKLEGDFNDYFTLYAPKGNEMEALEIFTPDTMAIMEDESRHFNVEFAGNRIYIYCNRYITKIEDLNQIFNLAKTLVEKISPLANRFKNDSSIVSTPVNIIKPIKQTSLKRSIILVIITTIILAILTIVAAKIYYSKYKNVNTSTNTTQSISITKVVSKNPNDFPYCGAIADSSMPTAAQEYLNATIPLNTARSTISSEISSNPKGNISSSILASTISADQNFVTTIQKIKFPTAAQNDALNLIDAINNYDNLLTSEINGSNVSSANLTNARNSRSNDSSKLRTDLNLPASTCSFYEP